LLIKAGGAKVHKPERAKAGIWALG
jgi:hypothetical protein